MQTNTRRQRQAARVDDRDKPAEGDKPVKEAEVAEEKKDNGQTEETKEN